MLPSNPAFMSRVRHERNKFVELMHQAKLEHMIYPSQHFFERVIERNLEAVDVLRMLVPVIQEFRGTTYNVRSYAIRWKQFSLFALINVGPVTATRRIVLKTIYDRDIDESGYDVVQRIT
jgi:hypothetical protein